MTQIPSFAPGCFGSALAYQDKSPVCGSCELASQCKVLHEVNFKRLYGEIVETRRKFEMPAATTENPAPGALTLPKKVAEEAARLDEMGLNIRENLKAGTNPFGPKFKKYLYVASHLLMNLKAPLRQDLLCNAYIGRLGYDTLTAKALARQALQIFQHIGVVSEIDGGFVLRRD